MCLQNTPLLLACLNGHLPAAKVLMGSKANVTAQDEDNLNCLDMAVESGHTYVIHFTCVLYYQNCFHPSCMTRSSFNDIVTCKVLTYSWCKSLCCPVVLHLLRKIALAIIQSPCWKEALSHSFGQMTPFRRMIQKMPCKQIMQNFMMGVFLYDLLSSTTYSSTATLYVMCWCCVMTCINATLSRKPH